MSFLCCSFHIFSCLLTDLLLVVFVREEEEEGRSSSFKTTILVSRFAANALRGVHRQRSTKRDQGDIMIHVPVPKPREPDFGADD